MKAKIVHVLCEGQTEQGFVEDVLKPYLLENGCAAVKSILVTTNKRMNACGGLESYQRVCNDLTIMLNANKDGEFERHIFTTMFDLYALPKEFPGYDEAHNIPDRYKRVAALENAFAGAIASDRFIPYIQLHEYEALVFCGLDYLCDMYKGTEKQIKQLNDELDRVGNPELVNDNPNTAPSKRIIKAIEGGRKTRFKYDKPKTGKYVAMRVGLENLRKQCPHFNEWIIQLLK